MRTAFLLLFSLSAFAGTSCSSTYYGLMEMVGKEKRDILVSRVKDARSEQVDAQEQFKTTLEAFQELTGFDGGDLEAAYKSFSAEYDDAADAAEDVSDRIGKVKSVAEDMFEEWESEIEEYTDPGLKSRSQTQLRDARSRYGDMMRSMESAEASMDPVLAAFKDQVLYLKHSLNAKALASLGDTAIEIESTVSDLITNMERSIAEAEAFIADLEG